MLIIPKDLNLLIIKFPSAWIFRIYTINYDLAENFWLLDVYMCACLITLLCWWIVRHGWNCYQVKLLLQPSTSHQLRLLHFLMVLLPVISLACFLLNGNSFSKKLGSREQNALATPVPLRRSLSPLCDENFIKGAKLPAPCSLFPKYVGLGKRETTARRLRRLQCLGLKGYESQGKTAKFQALALPPGVQWEPKYCGSGSLGHGK